MVSEYYFAHPWPIYATLGALAGLSLLAWLLYRRLKTEMPAWVKRLLLGLRVAAIVALCLYLMRPIRRDFEPDARHSDLIFLVDTSQSMAIRGQDDDRTRLALAKNRLLEPLDAGDDSLFARLGEQFRLKLYSLGPDAVPLAALADAEPDGQRTDFTAALHTLDRATLHHPAAAVVLISDGADNGPRRTDHLAKYFKSRGTPIHVLGVAAQAPADVGIRRVVARHKMRIDTLADVAVELSHHGCQGRVVPVTLRKGEQVLETKEVPLLGERPGCTFEIRPTEEGLVAYTVSVPIQPEERRYEPLCKNNAYTFAVDSSRRKLRVLYMEGTQRRREGRERWEHQYLKQALEEDQDVEVEVLLRDPVQAALKDQVHHLRDPVDGFPHTKKELFTYDVIISSDIDIECFTPEQLAHTVAFVNDHGGGFAMVGGWTAFGSGGYDDSVVDKLLPVDMAGREDGYVSEVEFAWQLTPDAWRHPIMQIDPDPAMNRRIWAALPKFKGFNKTVRAKPLATVLAVHPTLRTPLGSKRVLLAVQSYGRGRAMAFTSDTTAGWGEDFEDNWGERGDNRYYRTFWKNAVRWLAAARLNLPDNLVLIQTHKVIYESTETAPVRITVLDLERDPTDRADVRLDITHPDGTQTWRRVTPDQDQPGLYRFNVRLDKPGDYTLRVRARLDDVDLGEDLLAIRCVPASVEFRDYRFDEAHLRSIAQHSGGRYLPLDEADQLEALLEESTRRDLRRFDRDFWNQWPFLLLLVALLGAEWTIRKKHGLP